MALLALTLPVVAQRKNAKAQLNVEGICNSCKARIEKAALGVKGVKYAQWNVDTHQLSLVLDESKASTQQVQEAIAKVGHSNSLPDGSSKIEATEEDYNKVSDCCKYRDEEVVTSHHSTYSIREKRLFPLGDSLFPLFKNQSIKSHN